MKQPKETGLMFKTPLVLAIDQETKTQTRRPFDKNAHKKIKAAIDTGRIGNFFNTGKPTAADKAFVLSLCPFGGAGDYLFVRETWQHANYPDGKLQAGTPIFYAADYMQAEGGMRGEGRIWQPSIHMPKDAARLWLRIKNVRIERVQDITTKDILQEGVQIPREHKKRQFHLFGIEPEQRKQIKDKAARDAWQNLWESTGGNWVKNPWLWAIEFEKSQRPKKL